MFSRTFKSTCLAAGMLAIATLASAQGYTTRIEPRPFYGATISIEEGVRVIRPLPPERQVIINPGGQTPLSLGFNETRVYENRTIRNYLPNGSTQSDNGDRGQRVFGGYGYGGGRGYYGGYGQKHDSGPGAANPYRH